MSLDRASCHCNTSVGQETTFVFILNLYSCHWIGNVSPSGQRLIDLKISPGSPECLQNAFQIIFRAVVLRWRCFAVWKVWLEMDNLMKRTETLLREVVDHLERNRNSFGTEVGQEDEASSGGNSSNSRLTEASVEFR